MSLLGDLIGNLTGGGSGSGGNSSLLTTAIDLVNNHPGGLPGLLQSFQQQGLGGAVASWVGTGPNQSISADQVQNVLSSDVVKGFAEKLGISPDAATGTLAQVLPALINHVTPNGQVPQGNIGADGLGGLLENLLKGGAPASA